MKCVAALAACVVLALPAHAQLASILCRATSEQVVVRSEGLSERLGEIVLACTGGTPGLQVRASLSLFLSVPVANRLTSEETVDVMLTGDFGFGQQPLGGSPRLIGANTLAFDQFTFVVPPSGLSSFRIYNLRGSIPPNSEQRPVTARITTGGTTNISLDQSVLSVGFPQRGLLSNASSTQVVCLGSPLPDELTFRNLISAGTLFATTRVTEGFPTAFEARAAFGGTGTRLLMRYSGFPAGARVFVPDVISGSTAVEVTSAGDFGRRASGGAYAPSVNGSLVLARVRSADDKGSGGNPVYLPGALGSAVVFFDSVSEVFLTQGAGYVVYEVVDAAGGALEWAHVPTFLGYQPQAVNLVATARADVRLAPLSTVSGASLDAPVPRFRDVAPEVDCTILNDCQADYFPHLLVDPDPLSYTVKPVTGFYAKHIRIRNDGGGNLFWVVTIAYRHGANWLRADPAAGVNNRSVLLDVLPQGMAPGVYEATVTIDAGPIAGSRSLPVRMEVLPADAPPPPPPVEIKPVIGNVENAAVFIGAPLVPGSLAVLRGENMAGAIVNVTLNGIPAELLFAGARQINMKVPESLVPGQRVAVVVTADGRSSVPWMADVAAAAPGIFNGGILNQDSALNTPASPAEVGSVVQIFATGLPLPHLGAITARIHDRDITSPAYAGPAPGLNGVQQVNFAIPADLPTMVTELLVCGTPAAEPGRRICSLPALVNIVNR